MKVRLGKTIELSCVWHVEKQTGEEVMLLKKEQKQQQREIQFFTTNDMLLFGNNEWAKCVWLNDSCRANYGFVRRY